MLELFSTERADFPQLQEWVAADSWHRENETWLKTEGMLTGNGLLAFCIQDDKGPICYVRFDKDEDMLRIAVQFAPYSEVSKRRLIVGIANMLVPAIVNYGKEKGFRGAVYESTSPTLIAFMSKFGFKAAGGNDYALIFEEQHV